MNSHGRIFGFAGARTGLVALLATALAGATFLLPALAAPPLSGAIFTTTVDGSIVNENVRYEAKEDVYLDGGPGPNAPRGAAALPDGEYFFQVTDPSGKDLLSTDHIQCRRILVEGGVITQVVPGYTYVKQQGQYVQVDCEHNTGDDVDQGPGVDYTVQLYPYDDTPNPGGVYKVWVTPVGDYAFDQYYVPANGKDGIAVNAEGVTRFHGFIPAASKTDNYKVKKKGKPFDAPEITIKKFHDADLDGIWDADEEEVAGWNVTVVDPLGVSNPEITPATVLAAEAGDYTVTEATPDGTIQTVTIVDGSSSGTAGTASPTATITVEGVDGETHTIIFGNAGLGDVTSCKIFDRNGNGVTDAGEPGVEGWKFALTGTTSVGSVSATGTTGIDGCVTFSDLLPGSYQIAEVMPDAGTWMVTGIATQTFDMVSSLSGSIISAAPQWDAPGTGAFHNACTVTSAGFGTKGYWHNKNGLAEIEAAFVYGTVNDLPPYATESSYFGAGDEPFDGTFTDGTPVDAAFNNEDLLPIANAGTFLAEISHFLVDSNQGADPREQLAQQLLAFIFNVEYRLGGGGTILYGGELIDANALIGDAIAAWQGTDADFQNEIKSILDALNNKSDGVTYIPLEPCDVIYN